MKMFNKYVFFPKFLQDPSMIDALFPPSIDELKAESENDSLAEDEFMPASETDNHQQHILIHMMAKKTWATWIHMAMHEEMLGLQKKQEMQAQQPQPDQQQKPDAGGDKKPQSPMKATAPSVDLKLNNPNYQIIKRQCNYGLR